jgi:hypothetical protein
LLVLVGQQEGQAVPGGDPILPSKYARDLVHHIFCSPESVMSKRQYEQGRLGNSETLSAILQCHTGQRTWRKSSVGHDTPTLTRARNKLSGSSVTLYGTSPAQPGQRREIGLYQKIHNTVKCTPSRCGREELPILA